MTYEGRIFRPPSEADSYILQATIGCSWNKCTYCDMYRDKQYRARPVADVQRDVAAAGRQFGQQVQKVFVADGDALVLPLASWVPILEACRAAFPRLRRVSCYATARNLLKRVYLKTGVSRQNELARVMLNSPLLLPTPDNNSPPSQH